MEPWSIIAARWPTRVLEARRLCARDSEFREIVSDYQEALSALDRWRGIEGASSGRAAEYEDLIRELESEIDKRFTAP
jgi:hypothetical protein